MGISDEDLLDLAGAGPFERGYDYYREGRVIEFAMRGNITSALVGGTHVYRVELHHDGPELDGACDCPASDGIAFCKHCVATALELRDSLAESVLSATVDDGSLETYLAKQDSKTLASYLVQVLHKAPSLRDQLRKQAGIGAGPVDPKQLKQSITRVTPLQDIFEPGKVRVYLRRLETTLQGIQAIADELPAENLLEATVHGIDRLNKSLQHIDDSGGYREGAQAILRDLHIRSLNRINWSPASRGEHLLEIALKDPWDQFARIPIDYSDALGEAGLSAFYAAVERRLEAMPSLPDDADHEDKYAYFRLTNYLMARASELEDYDEMIRLEMLMATTEIGYERVARLYLKKGDPDEAAKWLSRADALDKDDRSGRKVLWASVHAARGDWKAATKARELAFRRDVSFEGYQELMELAEKAGNARNFRDSVIEFLQSDLQPGSWRDEHHAFTLAQIYRDEQDWIAIKGTALGRIKDPDRLLQVARWLAKFQLSAAQPIFEKAIDSFISRKTNFSYQVAVQTLLEARPAFDATSTTAFEDYLARVMDSHHRKRNFTALLDAANLLGPSFKQKGLPQRQRNM